MSNEKFSFFVNSDIQEEDAGKYYVEVQHRNRREKSEFFLAISQN